jgi:predicted RNA-binding protein associated with RNAse of E/G family
VLILTPPGVEHAIWWFFDRDANFIGWYVNLQTRTTRWSGGVDLVDQTLDVVVDADINWQWKDEDEFAERTGHPMYWDDAEAAAIRAEGQRVIAIAQAREFPFDGTWCDFRADPDWGPTPLPWWWDQNPDARQAMPTIVR